METKVFHNDVSEAADILRQGGLVAVPTETVYGLAANARSESAVEKIYEVKGRPPVKPLSLLVPGRGALDEYGAGVPAGAYALAEKFWPGPLTIVLRARPGTVPGIVLAGGDTVGLRCPDHPLTLVLLRRFGSSLAVPSANPSGAPPPKTAEEVLSYFDGKIDGVVDGGPCGLGEASTVFDMSRTPYRVLRWGALPLSEIADALEEAVTLIGITGGSGSGKTTALKVLEARGALILDCDEIYHQLTVTSSEMKDELCRRFGSVYGEGGLDRKKLGTIVFDDEKALADLNAITHRYVCEEVSRRLREYALAGGTLAAIDAIALLETDFARKTAFNVAVTAPVEARIQRLLHREDVTEEYARMRIAAQKSDEYFASHCDYVLKNDGGYKQFLIQCERFFEERLNKKNTFVSTPFGRGNKEKQREGSGMICKIIHIDEDKCNGCGLCASACHEGAIEIIGGKAKLVRENFCDGLGDCLPNCPTGAISFEEREAPAYDETAVKESQRKKEEEKKMEEKKLACGCPGTEMKQFQHEEPDEEPSASASRSVSRLGQWPCQIKLVPTQAPFFDGAKLLIAADCTAYAYANLHEDFMKGKTTLIGCPKLDGVDYTGKLTEIISNNDIKSVTIVRMEVPCCGGLQMAVQNALRTSGKFIPWQVVIISTDGKILDE